MTKTQDSKAEPASGSKATVGRLFILNLSGGNIFSVNPDGSDCQVIVTGCPYPDDIVMDVEAGHIYWTNMGYPNLCVRKDKLTGVCRVCASNEVEVTP